MLQREYQALRSQHTDLIQENAGLFNNQEKLYKENTRLKKNLLVGSLSVVAATTLAIDWYSKK